MSNDIALRVRKVIAETTELDLDKVSMDASREDLSLDSMRMVDLIFSLEEEFDLSLEFNANSNDESWSGMSKVSDFVEWIATQIRETS